MSLPELDVSGQQWKCGCLPRVCGLGAQFPLLADRIELIPESDWREVDWSHFVPEILNQDGIGACNAFAATSALRICRIMAGQPDVRLSPGHLYGRINGGRDQGSLLGDALEALMKEGVCTTDEVGELSWRKRDWPSGLEAISARYKITEAFDAPTFSHLATAILMGFVVDYGIMVGNAFDTDASGWVAEGGGRGGHAMCGVGLARREKRGKTQWGIVTVNSWGKQWGRDGLGIVPSSYFANETFTDGWAVRVAVDPSEEAYPA